MVEEIKNGKYQKPGKIYYYQNNKLHREDGPAIEFGNGYIFWFLNGKRHCEVGPAVEYPDGNKEWWINGIQFTKEDFNKWTLHKKLQIKLKEKNVVKNFKI